MKIYKATHITENIVNAFSKLIPQLSPDSPIPSKSDLEALINSDNTMIFLAEEEDIIGTLTVVLNRIPTGNKAWIEDVVVDESARGKGVGKKLTAFAIAFVSGKGISQINLTSTPERVAANQLYQQLGFRKRETNVYRLTLKE
ncbi:GNAT family N-acetyltransferase [Maribellus maritimus]|uniref:GNAT family N-acetyltransferase n=1 Tax=Maribellus maritimus TaxID=2870838 RepID=UPI001EEB4052|nr:GNAT family N-acetyltransferase [Maribellus maritimus]MCG6187453.1 GNAT family N-acetyltransferase [Maribellus maritimus]